jgi:GNAT superfamily N-acetyltransferase
MKVSEICSASDIDFSFPGGVSFFEPFLQYFTREILEIGGEVYVSRDNEGAVSGLFMYDTAEKVASIYTSSREVFDYFYGLKPFHYLFAEMKTELENEAYDIYSIDFEKLAIDHRFTHEISMAGSSQTEEIERFMTLTHQRINRKWVKVALKNGDKCFTVKLGSEIAGLGWVSLVNGIGRLHSLYVKPQFRRLGMGDDILGARLLWLKSKYARSVFSEISRYNFSCLRIAAKEHMKVSGQIYQYFKKPVFAKKETKS